MSADAGNLIAAGTDGGALIVSVDDADADPNNEIELPTGGTNGQVLTTDGSGNYAWADDATLGGTIVSADAGNLIAAGTDGGALIVTVDDADADPNNEIELPSGGTNGQVLTTDGSGNYAWADDADSGGTVVSTDAGNLIAVGTDGGALIISVDDADANPNNEIQTITSPDNSLTVTPVGNNYNIVINAVQGSFLGGPSVIIPNTIGQADIGDNAIGASEIQSNAVSSDEIADNSLTADDLAVGSVETGEILNGTILNEDIAAGAAIDGTKIDPDFGNLDISTTGTITATGDITTDGDLVDTTPDYVFQKYFLGNSDLKENYDFQTLEQIDAFIKQNYHLPGIKSAAEIKKQGFWSLTEASQKNLEKIEELFLHTIEQEKKIDQLKTENESLSAELQSLRKDMDEIKALLQNKN